MKVTKQNPISNKYNFILNFLFMKEILRKLTWFPQKNYVRMYSKDAWCCEGR